MLFFGLSQVQVAGERGDERVFETQCVSSLLPLSLPCLSRTSTWTPPGLLADPFHGGRDDRRASASQAGHRAAEKESEESEAQEVSTHVEHILIRCFW